MTQTDDQRAGALADRSSPELLLELADALRRKAPIPETVRAWLLSGIVQRMAGDETLEEALGLEPEALQTFRLTQRNRWLVKAAEFVEDKQRVADLDAAIRLLEGSRGRRYRNADQPPASRLVAALLKARCFGKLPGARQLRRILESDIGPIGMSLNPHETALHHDRSKSSHEAAHATFGGEE